MFKNLLNDLSKTPVLAGIVIVSYFAKAKIEALLNHHYALSKFPVPFYEAQLSFNADKLRQWYQYLHEHGTFEQYIFTQHFDFYFMACVLILHFSCLQLIATFLKNNIRLNKLFCRFAFLSCLAPLADALENGVAYIMLANSQYFPDYLALIYSSFAAIKFSMFVLTYIAIAVGIFTIALVYLKKLFKPKASTNTVPYINS